MRFDRLRTQWTRRGPLLRLDGLRVGQGEGIRIGEAEVLVSLYAGILPGRSFTELRLRGLSLACSAATPGNGRCAACRAAVRAIHWTACNGWASCR